MEFTGERVIPGLVDVDLWNEHIGRYLFASRFAEAKCVLDIGCGTGYGTAELAKTARCTTGVDVAADAIEFARHHYRAPGLNYVQASATQLPTESGSIDLIVALEVIEHLHDWELLLAEAQRVVTPDGLFIVSTPNKDFYRQTRAETGPNPFHHHEFTSIEFREVLSRFFPNITIVLQDHVAGIAFRPEIGHKNGDSLLSEVLHHPETSNFFIAICSKSTLPAVTPFVYLPGSANLLKERADHIKRLQDELAMKNEWLSAKHSEHSDLVHLHQAQTTELRERNLWAESLNHEIGRNRERILQLQTEVESLSAEFANAQLRMHAELQSRTEWARANERQFQSCLERLHQVEADLEEQTSWSISLDGQRQALEVQVSTLTSQLQAVHSSRWVRLGRKAGLGPKLPPA